VCDAVAVNAHSPAAKYARANPWPIAEQFDRVVTRSHHEAETPAVEGDRANDAGAADDAHCVGSNAAARRAAQGGASHRAAAGRMRGAKLEPTHDCGEDDWPRTEGRTFERVFMYPDPPGHRVVDYDARDCAAAEAEPDVVQRDRVVLAVRRVRPAGMGNVGGRIRPAPL